jgi:hypothetical protein
VYTDRLLSLLPQILKRPQMDIASRLITFDQFYIIAVCLFQIDALLLMLNRLITFTAISSISKSQSNRLQCLRAVILNVEITRLSSSDPSVAMRE